MRAGARHSWLVLDSDGKPQEVMPTNRLQMDDLQAIADAATAGFGIAWLPCWLVREQLLSGALVRCCVTGRAPPLKRMRCGRTRLTCR